MAQTHAAFHMRRVNSAARPAGSRPIPATPRVRASQAQGHRPQLLCQAAATEGVPSLKDIAPRVGQFLATAALAFAACTASPASAADLPQATSSKALPETVYFGNGCFWGRQKDFVDTEKALSKQVTAVVGYAGGVSSGPDGRVCYYYSDPRTVYERLGHAEVVKVDLGSPNDPAQATSQFRQFAQTYFADFQRTPFGMRRLDPQDAGPGYRNVVGLPGGVRSPLFQVLQQENKNSMELREGKGNQYSGFLSQPTEDDLLNVVWVVDSNQLPFYQAEAYHQFHNGIGKAFPKDYTRDLKNQLVSEGRIGPTGCPELPF